MTTIFNFYLFISIILNDGQILDGQGSVKYFFFCNFLFVFISIWWLILVCNFSLSSSLLPTHISILYPPVNVMLVNVILSRLQ